MSKVCESIIHERLLTHLMENNIITTKQAAYLKGDSTQSQLLYLIHTIRQAWGNKLVSHAVFLDISAAFDKVWHKGLIAKLTEVGVSGQFLQVLESYLNNRKQKVMIDGVPSEEVSIKSGVPQGSRLGPLLFLVYINDIVKDLECDCLLFADDCCLIYNATDPNISACLLNKNLEKISLWAIKWKVTFNASKSKDIIFSKKCLYNSPPLYFNSSLIDRVASHKHLGVYLTNNLDWSLHINETCSKAHKKLAVLRSVRLLHRNTLDILYKLTVRSIIDYGLTVFGSTLKQSDLDRLERLQYSAGKICTGALHLTSKEKLNLEMGWESIKTRIDFLGLSLFHKIHVGETRPLIKTYMTDYIVKPNSKLNATYKLHPNYGVKFSNSFFPYFTKKWNSLPRSIKFLDLPEFKSALKTELKPTKIKYFAYGGKLPNKLITRLRVGRSFLNGHSFCIGKSESPSCLCHEKNETVLHYLLFCFLYTFERQVSFDQVTQYLPNFLRLSQSKKVDFLLNGCPKLNHDSNVEITKNVQNYILKTKRFIIRN